MFATEDQLINSFLKKHEDFLRYLLGTRFSDYFVLNEFDSLYGVADLVLGTLKPSEERIGKPLNLNWLMPLISFKSGQRIERAEFEERYRLSKRSASDRIRAYIEAGFLKKLDATTFDVTMEYQPITDSVVSIEAKLRNWKKASLQAQRYKRFSDYTFVLLDEAYSKSAISQLAAFKENNVGLITASHYGFNVHYVPNKNEKKYNEYYMRVNEAAFKQISIPRKSS